MSTVGFKENLNATKPSEQSKDLGGNVGCKDKHSWFDCCCFSNSAHWLPTRKKVLYTVANPARGLLNRAKITKEKSLAAYPPHPQPPTLLVRRKNKIKNHATHLQALRRSRSVSRPYKDSFGSLTRSKGLASQNCTLPCAITNFPVSLLLSSPGDV